MSNLLLQIQQGVSFSSYIVPIVLFIAAQTIALIVTAVTIYVKFSTKMRELEVRINAAEQGSTYIRTSLEEIKESIHEIDLKLVEKVNRS